MKIGNLKLEVFPILLAPMEEITGSAFRRLCKHYGADIVYTEFIAADGLIRDAKKSMQKLYFQENERPIGIQIFGNDESGMRKAAEVAAEANPDIIDINWGCPVKKVVKKFSGSGMLQAPEQLIKITAEVVKSVNIPVTVKTRLGWDESNKPIVELSERLQDAGIKALTIHGRTRSQLYKGKADWTLIGKIKENPRIKIPIFGNGDITSPEIALAMKEKYHVDGIMIGRAAIGNPYIFTQTKHFIKTGTLLPPLSLAKKAALCRKHLLEEIYEKGERSAIFEMRRQYAHYFKGISGIKPYRIELMQVENVDQVLSILDKILTLE
ncbi:MAG: tRNA dihydrouridine synthase DusB [Bacteroidales bacterium]|nr:tRNA dihydrouridine synthase DusB [Bacteroidales bacterium]